jgi:hypothetical protein
MSRTALLLRFAAPTPRRDGHEGLTTLSRPALAHRPQPRNSRMITLAGIRQMAEYEIYCRQAGSRDEHERWILVVPDVGEPIVRCDCFRGSTEHARSEEAPLSVFWKQHNGGILRERLAAALDWLGIDPDAVLDASS